MKRFCGYVIALLLIVPGYVGAAWAEAGYPNKPIRFIVPNPPGGLPDTVARLLAQQLGERLGQPVIIDNRPGANGVVAAQALSASPADGYTFLVTDGSMLSVNPVIYKNLGYNPKKDFVPVSLVATAPLFLAVHTKVPANNLQEFIQLAKTKPGSINYGSSGVGSTHHLTMEAMNDALGLKMTHVPFKGTGQSVPALIGEQVEALFSAYPSLSGFVKTGQVRILANNSAQRSRLAPNVPSLSELIPGFDFAPAIGVLAASGTPVAVIQRISAEIAQIAKKPEFIQQMGSAGIEPIGAGPAEYAAAIQRETERYAKVINAVGLQAQ